MIYICSDFEELAIGVLKIFNEKTSGLVSDILILRYDKHLLMDYLELAIETDCKTLVASNYVQTVLDDIWSGKQIEINSLVILLLLLLLSFYK
jgi:hypothetical protein